ncbi:MAG: class I SAM-dependent methyltransferase [Actinobacteria bacterium]|nr:class I SAM-dependent methyltransferase [Actinomycetota bacterium]
MHENPALEDDVQERRRKIAQWYDQYETLSEIILDSQLSGVLLKGKNWMEGFRAEMVYQLAGDVTGKKALDIGCQYGVFSFYLAQRGAMVTGMDISKNWVNRCVRDAARLYPDKGCEFLVGDAQDLPFEDESFDVVVCTEVIEHVDFAGNVLAEIYRVLVPGGVLVIGTPNTRSYYVWIWQVLKGILPMSLIKSAIRKVVNLSQEDIMERVRANLPEERREEYEREYRKLEALSRELGIEEEGEEEFHEHIREFSGKELESLLDFSGFEVEKRTGFPVFPTYYFLTLRMLYREHFVKVKDNSWWRYRSSPMNYLRAVKAAKPVFHL